jgi:hypothetical protein
MKLIMTSNTRRLKRGARIDYNRGQSVTNAKRKRVRLTAGSIIVISVALQSLFIPWLWWNQDPSYIIAMGSAIGSWLVAGVAMLLGRFVRGYISGLLPAGAALAFIFVMIGYWDERRIAHPFGEPTLELMIVFALVAVFFVGFLVGPVTGAWLLGFSARVEQQGKRILSVFS